MVTLLHLHSSCGPWPQPSDQIGARVDSRHVRLFGRPLTKCRPFALWRCKSEGVMRTLAHGLPSRPLGAHLAAADVLSGGCCWSSSTRAFVIEVYTSVSAGRTVPGARRVRICVLFNVIVRYTHATSQVLSVPAFGSTPFPEKTRIQQLCN